jgi:hypothetical protein
MISVNKIFYIIGLIFISVYTVTAQSTFSEQFNFAKNLYNEEKYFDAVTEFKRLLFFDEENNFFYEANKFIGLSYKQGAKFSDAVYHFTVSEKNAAEHLLYLIL